MWKISKAIDFCYGHRVWVQKLNQEYSLDGCLKCRHLHGHQGQIIIELGGKLDNQSMVTDFKHLNWFKDFVDKELDHKFIIDKSDPYLPFLFGSGGLKKYQEVVLLGDFGFPCFVKKNNLIDFWVPFIQDNLFSFEKEILEGLVIVPFVPTSEQLSTWFFNIAAQKMKEIDVEVTKVTFKETPKTSAEYTRE